MLLYGLQIFILKIMKYIHLLYPTYFVYYISSLTHSPKFIVAIPVRNP